MTPSLQASASKQGLAVGLDGWLLDSGQIDAVVLGQQLSFALEIGSIRASTDPGPSERTHLGLLDLRVSATVRDVGPRTTILDVGFPAYVATELVEEVLTAHSSGTSALGAAIDVLVTLSIDPYTGRARPEPLPPDLVLPWIVTDISRHDVDEHEFRSVSTTLPHSATTAYVLQVVPAPAV